MITIVAVKYLEPWYQKTIDCLYSLDMPIVWVDRKGVGSLAEAYNRGFKKVQTDNVWFVSNIVFDKSVPLKLLNTLKDYHAVHPQFESHHKFIRSGSGIQPCEFVEFTAPMIRSKVYEDIQLNENLPYWGHDIVFGIEAKKRGYKMAIDHRVKVGHTYIWDQKEYPITAKRKALRLSKDKETELYLNLHYPNWKECLKP